MSLLGKLFGDKAAPSASASTQFHASELEDTQDGTRQTPRRELVHVVLRETMRRHGIPSDWIECRVLAMVSRRAKSSVQVTFVVRGGHDRLLAYVPAFQNSFWDAMLRFEPKARDWLAGLSWQFDGMEAKAMPMPDPASWIQPGTVAAAPSGQRQGAPADEDDDLEQDLQALFAIRDAALRTDSDTPDFQPTQPGR